MGEETAKKLGTLDVWALGVGIVICGQYFGWNLGLPGNGPVAMLLASLFVCLLFVAWLLALAELSVAMPYADGPLEYGRRAWGQGLGFGLAWSLLLASQFGAIATALASGRYVAFLLNPDEPDPYVFLWSALATVVLFFFLQAWGVKEQASTLLVMTFVALGGLVIYWSVAATNFSWERVWPEGPPLGPKGWKGVGDAIPYALWWLIIIEGAALAAADCRDPGRNIPRGLIAAILTVVVLVVLTLGLGCGAVPWQDITGEYPLGKVVHEVLGGRLPWLVRGFSVIALFGLIASYHGLLYPTSRQAFALGRAGYLPAFLGRLHARGTPINALLVSSVITAGFVVASLRYRDAIDVAILVAGLASLVWYILAMICLLILRKRSGEMFAGYRAPLGPVLPVAVIVLSLFTVAVFAGIEVQVLPLAAVLYAAGYGYYLLAARPQIRACEGEKAAGEPLSN